MATQYRNYGPPRQYRYVNGQYEQWDPSVQKYVPRFIPNPFHNQSSLDGGEFGFDGGGNVNGGGQQLPSWFQAMLNKNGSGYNSQYEQQLANLLNRPMAQPEFNSFTNKISGIADQLANFRPATTLPPEMMAQINAMKNASMAGVEKSATKASDQLAGLLYQNTGGGSGTQADFAKTALAGEIGGLRQGVESDYANKILQELGNYNQNRLAGLQAGMGGYGQAGGFQESAISRNLGNQYNDIGFRSDILNRLLSSERDRHSQDTDLALQLLRMGYRM